MTRVVAAYPSGGELPRNALRLYVLFSEEMSEGDAGRCVRIVSDDTGEPLEDALLPTRFELWDPGLMRLTLFLDPARIKRGLVPHDEAGYPLQTGVAVRLVVDAALRDANRLPLDSSFEKRYEVGADIRARVNAGAWSLREPRAGTREPLAITFDRPLDHGLLQRCLVVTYADGRIVEGSADIPAGELTWQFRPVSLWGAGRYRLAIDATLEDVAGNSVKRVFDRDLADEEDSSLAVNRVNVDFGVVVDA